MIITSIPKKEATMMAVIIASKFFEDDDQQPLCAGGGGTPFGGYGNGAVTASHAYTMPIYDNLVKTEQ